MSRSGLVLLATLLFLGCPSEQIGEPGLDVVGTWEVVQEPVVPGLDDESVQPQTVEQHRYVFHQDSTMQIYRPRPTGPATQVFAVYDFRGDTLVIRSEFDSGYYIPSLSNDTLYLQPIDSGRPLTLVRRSDDAPPASVAPPAPPEMEGDYSPPPDLPPDEMPQ